MPSSSNLIASVVAAGLGGALLFYWLKRRESKSGIVIVDVKQESSPPVTKDEPLSPPSPVFSEILELLGAISHPSPEEIDRLQSMLSRLSESELIELKLHSDYVSFSLSEWMFYHTLRTNKEIHWNSNTGLVDEAVSPQQREIGARIASTMRAVYWDQHLSDLNKSPPEYQRVLDRLAELQTRINSYQRGRAQPVWDLQLVDQVVKNKQFDRAFFISILRRAIEVLYDLESPAAHDDTVKHFQENVFKRSVESVSAFHHEIVESLAFLFAQLDLLDAELANYKSNQMSIETKRRQERQTFVALVEKNLVRTEKLKKLMIPVFESSSSIGKTNRGIVVALKNAVIGAVIGSVAVDDLPEPLMLDRQQLLSLKQRVVSVADTAAFLVGLQSQLPIAFGESASKLLANKQNIENLARAIIKLFLHNQPAEIIDEVLAAVVSYGGQVNDEQITSFKDGIEQCSAKSSQVRQLFGRRVPQLLEQGINAPSPDLPSNALGSHPWYLSFVVKELSEIVTEVLHLITGHLHVYHPVYREINES